ncbi:MAG: Gfo/Idh/MocA family oxidoreductase, partial [Planctomycetes bacterium]|nr:Gfo/Idh/MocA family oxidoreductase [Planctomycetota bacterium]
MTSPHRTAPTRREFLAGTTGLVAAASTGALTSPVFASPHVGHDSTLRVALVGCGGRGTGAAEQALATERTLGLGPVKLVAIADAFADRIESARKFWREQRAAQCDLPDERCFTGFDAYRHAIDAVAPGGVVVLASPACFRAIHVDYAVDKGVHVFMEKAFGVDAPNLRRLIAAGKRADGKRLVVVGGLMSRYAPYNEELMARVHAGAIGEIAHLEVCRMHGPVPLAATHEGRSELEYQIRHQWGFGWVGGTFILDWLIHGIDLACWMKNDWPVSAQGMGGRQLRAHPDTAFDHWAVQYTFADGATMIVNGR